MAVSLLYYCIINQLKSRVFLLCFVVCFYRLKIFSFFLEFFLKLFAYVEYILYICIIKQETTRRTLSGTIKQPSRADPRHQ